MKKGNQFPLKIMAECQWKCFLKSSAKIYIALLSTSSPETLVHLKNNRHPIMQSFPSVFSMSLLSQVRTAAFFAAAAVGVPD